MRVVFLILRLLGMAFVVLVCLNVIRRMAMIYQLTGAWWFLALAIVIFIAYFFWAYRVIWRPIKPKKSRP